MAGFKAGSVFVEIEPQIDEQQLRRNLKDTATRAGRAAKIQPTVEIDPAQVTRDTVRATERASRGAKIEPKVEIDQSALAQQIARTESRLKALRIDAEVAPQVDRAKLNRSIGEAESRLSKLKARVDVDQRQVGREADKASGTFARAFKRGVGAAAGYFAVDQIVAFGRETIEAGSNAEQGIGAVESVFKQNAATVEQWASQSSRAVGLSGNSYRDLATVLGAALGNMGVGMDQVARQTNDLIKLGADLAATYGGTTAEAVEALSSALRGETDPIERYGISVNATAVQAELAAQGLGKLEGAAGRVAKTQALLTIINNQAAAAQGSFGREADTFAGQQQRLSARIDDLKTQIGTALIPVMFQATKTVAATSDAFGEMPQALQIGAVALAGLGTAAVVVVPKLVEFKKALDTIAASSAAQSAMGRFSAGLSGTAGLLMGPWGLALAGAAAGITVFAVKHQQAKQRVEEMTEAIKADSGALGENVRARAQNTLATNGALESAQRLGLNLADVTDAAAGNKDALGRVTEALDRLKASQSGVGNPFTGQSRMASDANTVRDAIGGVNNETKQAQDRFKMLEAASGGAAAKQRAMATEAANARDAIAGAKNEAKRYRDSLQQLIDKFTILNSGGLDAARAQDALAEAFDSAKDSARSTRNAFDSNTKAGRTNRGAIADLAQAINDKVTADFKAKSSTGDVAGATRAAARDTEKYRKRLEDEAVAAGASREQARKYVAQLLRTPKQIQTDMKAVGNAHQKLDELKAKLKDLDEQRILVDLKVRGSGLDQNVARKNRRDGGPIGPLQRRADGGRLRGPGTGRSDSILGVDKSTGTPTALVSNGEYVVNAESTRKYLPLIEAINAGQLKTGGLVKSALDAVLRRASGGSVNIRTNAVGTGQTVSDIEEFIDSAKKRVAAAAVAADAGAGGIGGTGGGNAMGYQRQMAILRAQFPGLALTSGFRRGAITATGNVSYHSRGRAVDVPPSMRVFNWIRSNYGRSTKELIYSPAGNRQVWNGKPHYYTGITRSMHFNHVHWAMANGGLVGPNEARVRREYNARVRLADEHYRTATRGRETAAQRRAAAKVRDNAKAEARRVRTQDLAEARRTDAAAQTSVGSAIRREAGGSFFDNDPGFARTAARATNYGEAVSAAAPLGAALREGRAAGVISPGTFTATYNRLVRETNQLGVLANRRAAIARSMDTLTGIRDERNQTAAATRTAVNTYGGVFAGQGAGVTSGTVRGVLAARLTRIRTFAANIRTLRAQKWSTSVIRQVVDAGVEDGSAMAAALVRAPKADRDAINGTVVAIDAQGAALGTTTANYYAADQMRAAGFSAGQRTVDGLIAGFRQQDTAVTAAMQSLADRMVSSLKRSLGIRSPSAVFAELGKYVPQGFAQGIESSAGLPVAALERMYAAPAAVGSGPARAVGAVRAGGGGPLMHVESMHLHDGVDVATMTQQLEFLSRRASI